MSSMSLNTVQCLSGDGGFTFCHSLRDLTVWNMFFLSKKLHAFFIEVCTQYETFICPPNPGTASVYVYCLSKLFYLYLFLFHYFMFMYQRAFK